MITSQARIPTPVPLTHDPIIARLLAEREFCADLVRAPNAWRDDPRLSQVIGVTQEVFGSEPTFEVIDDPEDPIHPFLVATVRAHGETQELVRRCMAWHQRLREVLPDSSGIFRLSVIPV